ncbi:MAG: DUF3488 domain-containing protein [Oscillatoriales cyanobacterium SM2_2_1]|nr:DUF3488 domain-containing protein [Oscillatoriales cyanobacterium SM2_2_1]
MASAAVQESRLEVEESIPLRVMVQLLVFIGIGAADVATGSTNSFWAIPLSAIGAGWGWYARHQRNLVVKFLIAVTMIVMLVLFLRDLLTLQDETRTLLARLLIQLQVLHSFDLPRRKDLGYSVTIGMILLALAATQSQTMGFAVWLVIFLVVALPVLILDQRSRLGILTRQFQPQKLGLSPAPMLGLLAVVLVLGLGIFLFLPRLPGLQLQDFPVSVNISVQRQVPAGGIISRPNTPNTPTGVDPSGTGGTVTPGAEGDASSLPPLFGEEIDTTGNASQSPDPQLVMRVRSQAALFWRVLAYDEYTGKGWRISRNDKDKGQIRTFRRAPWNYEFLLADGRFQVDSSALRQVIQTYTITSRDFPNLIPAASIPFRLFFPSEEIDVDLEGGIRSPGPLPESLTYTVVSAVPIRDEAVLRKAPARYPRFIRDHYLAVPEAIAPMLKQRAEQFFAEAKDADGRPIDLSSPYLKANYLTSVIKQSFKLNDQESDGSDLVGQFLTNGGGRESNFVTTLALMLRSVGVPTRFATGFAPGNFNPFTGLYEVYNYDTISLVEVFFPRRGWLAFDPVPGRPVTPPSIEQNRTFSALEAFWQWVRSLLPEPVANVWGDRPRDHPSYYRIGGLDHCDLE